ncbi:MAG: twin-arginine translocase TatA/TatE family subunit [Deltaproteobacteria bacterium]|nr:twin-arginine translocase TatA/TatE family subunit [Deltaproteobacteria bacterium]
MPGFVELVFLIVILVIVFGFHRLPAMGEALGRTIHNLRSAPPPKTPVGLLPDGRSAEQEKQATPEDRS